MRMYVNNNGNLTFDDCLLAVDTKNDSTRTSPPDDRPVLGPTSSTSRAGSGVVTYGTGSIDGHTAFRRQLDQCRLFLQPHRQTQRSFQLILIDRSRHRPGQFRFRVQLRQDSMGKPAISAPVPMASGGFFGTRRLLQMAAGAMAHSLSLAGSAVARIIPRYESDDRADLCRRLNSSQPGRYAFSVRNGTISPRDTATVIGAGVPVTGSASAAIGANWYKSQAAAARFDHPCGVEQTGAGL